MLTVHGRTNSSNVQKILWLCDELEIPFTLVERGGAHGGTKDPDYLALNPNGLVPTVVTDDGLVLWESNAIMRYLTTTVGAGRFYGTDPRTRAIVDQWLDWSATLLSPAITPAFFNLVRYAEADRDPKAIADSTARTAAAFTLLEGQLSSRAHIAGDGFTIADIPCGIVAWRWHNMPMERPDLPAVEAWYARLQERPAYRARVMMPVT